VKDNDQQDVGTIKVFTKFNPEQEEVQSQKTEGDQDDVVVQPVSKEELDDSKRDKSKK